jgi:DNA-binding response OmpR family regulator
MKETILFLDDDRYEMQSYIDKLRAEGFEVIPFTASDEALQHLQKKPSIDLMIVDLIMRFGPTESTNDAHLAGFRFCKMVRESLHIECPIVVLTVVSDEDIIKPLRNLADVVLHKPIVPAELARCVKERLK